MKRKTELDPLLAALIAKLPAAGMEWPVEEQTAWLKITAMAFATVYGGSAAIQFASEKPPPAAKPQAQAQPKAKPASVHRFIIDADGYAKDHKGKRIIASDIEAGEYIFDMRGALSDMRSIVWADGSVGLNGADIVIHS